MILRPRVTVAVDAVYARKTSNAMTRQTQHRPAGRRNRRTEIVRAAAAVFWDSGYAAASISEVAAQVGVLKGSLYHYIDSKEDLLEWIVRDAQRRSDEILDAASALDAPPIAQLWTYIEQRTLWALDAPQVATVAIREWRHLTGERLDAAIAWQEAHDERAGALVNAAHREGTLGEHVDLPCTVRYALAAIDAAPEWFHADGGDPPQRIARTFADLTVGMLVGTRLPVAPGVGSAERAA
jgi:AcrR family transcriptional regulator